MSWFGTRGSAAYAGAGVNRGFQVTGARLGRRGPGVSRYALLDRARSSRRGELPKTPSPGRQTAGPVRFATERAACQTRPRNEAPRPSRPGVVIISPPSDLLAQLVAMSLMYAHVPTCQLDPGELETIELEWHGRSVSVNGSPISGLLWRALHPGVADPKVTASWLAVASSPSMRAVNAYDPDAWCRGAGWSVWGDRLAAGGVPVETSCEPRPAAAPSLVVCGKVVAGKANPAVAAAADTLEESGVHLATVTSLPDGRVTNVDPQPDVSDPVHARRAAARIADYLAA